MPTRRSVVGIWLPVLSLLAAGPVYGQDAGGKIEGRVLDKQGDPLPAVRVIVVGTAFGTLTSPRGYYFFNGLPAGSVTLQFAAIGYASQQIRDVRVIAGQSVTHDIQMELAPVELESITIEAATNPLVPRDAVTTRQIASGDFVDALPVDRIDAALVLQPGVTRTDRGQLTIRGGRPDEVAYYLDGVPISPGFRLNTPGFLGIPPTTLDLGTNALQQATVTTGALSAEFGNAQSGIISLLSRSGGPTLMGNFGYETDEVFGTGRSLGFNRFTGSVGGPVVGRLHFFLSAMLEGQRSAEGGWESENAPIFLAAETDTVVAVPSVLDSPDADTTFVPVQSFAVVRGDCAAFKASGNPDIARNYGQECGGIRVPFSFESRYQLLGKLSYTFGSGSLLSLSLNTAQNQGRDFNYTAAFDPLYNFGHRFTNQIVTLNWRQTLTRATEQAASLDLYVSYQRDRSVSGPLTVQGEQESRDPTLGIRVSPLDLLYDFDNFPITDELVRNFLLLDGSSRAQQGEPGDFATIDRYRNNPYGVLGFSEGGGPNGLLSLQEERRFYGKAVLDWQLDRHNRVRAGAEMTRHRIGFYGHDLNFTFAGDVWIRKPWTWSAFVEDRVDVGDVILVGGLRFDWYNSDGRAPFWYDSTTGDLRYFPRISTNPDFVGSDPDAVFRSYKSHSYLSPHVQVSFPITDVTNFRFSYAHQVEVPDMAAMLRRANTDFSQSGGLYGSDLDFTKTIAFEAGIRRAFGPDMVLDLAAFARNKLSDITGRNFQLYDPVALDTVNVQRMTTADYGLVKGLDIRLDRRIGRLMNGFLAYTYQDARNTGDDPLSYLNRQSVLVSATTGLTVLPPQAVLVTRDSRPHNLSGAFALQFPADWREGTVVGTILARTGIFATFRFFSGTAYTRCAAIAGNEGFTSEQGGCTFDAGLGDFNGARLPSQKRFDLRVTRGFQVGPLIATAYLDARNLFNFRNVLRVFSAYNDVVSKAERDLHWAADSSAWATEGSAVGVRDSLGNLDLRFGGAVASGCGNWTTASLTPAAPNCIYLIRAEERFGNGDHIFDPAEMRRASDALYFVNRGPQTFLDAPRRLRIGLELSF